MKTLTLAMHLVDGQPARGPELGSVKFRNSTFFVRNFFVIGDNAFYSTEYHKARASTNFSYFFVRYFPPHLTQLAMLYIAYIHPFCNLLFNQISFKNDGDYLFCSEESNHKCWDGKVLTRILQDESKARLDVKINLWAYRHIAIAIAKMHVKEIVDHFEKDDALWERMLVQSKDRSVYA